MTGALELAARRRPPALAGATLATVAATVLGGLAWAHFAVLDVVTHADGKVVPSRQIQVVQSFEGGILRELLVAEGDRVGEGQVLARMDGTAFEAEAEANRARRLALSAAAARLEAEAEDGELALPAEVEAGAPEAAAREHALFAARRQERTSTQAVLAQQLTQREAERALLEARTQAIARSLAIVDQELAMVRELAERGLKSKAELLRLERQSSDAMAEQETTRARLPAARAAVQEVRRRMDERARAFRSAALNDLTRTKAELAVQDASATAMRDRVRRRELTAPSAGTVKRILVTTRGGVLQPGTELLEIVPADDTLLVEGKVRPADIAFLHPGQPAAVRLTAYDPSIYGGLDGTLEHISADTLADRAGDAFYVVRVRTGPTALQVLPGMTATIDIRTGRQSVLDYLLQPIRKARMTALTER